MIAWSLSSSLLILIILLLRFLFRKRLPLRLRYALWGLVLLRLLCPWSLGESRLSFMTAVEGSRLYSSAARTLETTKVPSGVLRDTELSLEEAMEAHGGTVYKYQGRPRAELAASGQTAFSFEEMLHTYFFEDRLRVVLERVLGRIWPAGMTVLGLWFLLANLLFSLRLRRGRVPLAGTGCSLPVFLCGASETPCLFGLFRPAVYLPREAASDPAALRHILTHEETHFRHGDQVWALLRGLCLVLHWYNPLVWLAALCSRQDAELACDEGTILRLGETERAAYGRTLLAMSSPGRPALLRSATTMTGGARSLRERITLLVKKPKSALWALGLALLLAAGAAGCAFAGAKEPLPAVTERPIRPDYAAEASPVGLSVIESSPSDLRVAAAWAEAYAARFAEELSPDSPLRCRRAWSGGSAPIAESLFAPRTLICRMIFGFETEDETALREGLHPFGFTEHRRVAESSGDKAPFELQINVRLVQTGENTWTCTESGSEVIKDSFWGYISYDADSVVRFMIGTTLRDETTEEAILAMLPLLDWDRFLKNRGNAGRDELLEALEAACISEGRVHDPGPELWSEVYPEDQAYRDMYVLLAVKNTDGACTEALASILQRQRDYDPETFERCLEEFPERERDYYRALADRGTSG